MKQITVELDEDSSLLWVVNNGEERSLPLVASTVQLLQFLQLPVPGLVQEEKPPKDDDDDSHPVREIEINVVESNDSSADENDPAVASPSEADKSNNEDDANESSAENESFQTLFRNKESVNVILKALMHIRDFYRDIPSTEQAGKKGKRMSSRDQRLNALEHQRDRLHKQLTLDENGGGEMDGKDSDPDHWEDAWIILVRILNSISVITPILLRMLFHPRRDDTSLVIHNTRINRGNAKKHTCWLLGEHVYDVCRTQTRSRLCAHLVEIFVFMGISEKNVSGEFSLWQKVLLEAMRDVSSRANGTNFVERQQSFHSVLKEKRLVAKELLHGLDKQFGLSQDKNPIEHAKYLEAVYRLHENLTKVLKGVFPDAVLSIYGSCLSDLNLGSSSDVDISLHIVQAQRNKDAFERGQLPAAVYEREMKNTVYKVCRKLESRRSEYRNFEPVTRARVPVLRGTYINAGNPYSRDGSIEFDICFLNDIAVANSSLLREYSLVDCRVKQLMVAVKSWAKENHICSARDNTFSSYTWMVLVIFYLQNLNFVPNLQSKTLMEKAGVVRDKNNRWHAINNLDTCYASWKAASSVWTRDEQLEPMSVIELLYGFFYFYTHEFQRYWYLISIKRAGEGPIPKTVFRKCSFQFVIEDPFETYDSHCPHDLGRHANEPGMKKIVKCLNNAEVHLKELLGRALDGEAINNPSLWSTNGGRQHNNTKTAPAQKVDVTTKDGSNEDKKPTPMSTSDKASEKEKVSIPVENKIDSDQVAENMDNDLATETKDQADDNNEASEVQKKMQSLSLNPATTNEDSHDGTTKSHQQKQPKRRNNRNRNRSNEPPAVTNKTLEKPGVTTVDHTADKEDKAGHGNEKPVTQAQEKAEGKSDAIETHQHVQSQSGKPSTNGATDAQNNVKPKRKRNRKKKGGAPVVSDQSADNKTQDNGQNANVVQQSNNITKDHANGKQGQQPKQSPLVNQQAAAGASLANDATKGEQTESGTKENSDVQGGKTQPSKNRRRGGKGKNKGGASPNTPENGNVSSTNTKGGDLPSPQSTAVTNQNQNKPSAPVPPEQPPKNSAVSSEKGPAAPAATSVTTMNNSPTTTTTTHQNNSQSKPKRKRNGRKPSAVTHGDEQQQNTIPDSSASTQPAGGGGDSQKRKGGPDQNDNKKQNAQKNPNGNNRWRGGRGKRAGGPKGETNKESTAKHHKVAQS